MGALAAPQLLVSELPNRSGAVPLSNQAITGEAFIFVGPATDLKRVEFYLDAGPPASPRQTENIPAFDFAGTAADGTAYPFDTTTEADGQHTVTARITYNSGATETQSGLITIDNSIPALSFSDVSQSFALPEDAAPASQSVDLSATSGSASFSVSDNAEWLSVSPSTGTTPSNLTLTVDPSSLAPGSYEATVQATASGHDTASLIVLLDVVPAASSSTYPLRLSTNSSRTGAIDLHGAGVSGDIFVFVAEQPEIEQVRFYINDPENTGSPYQTENKVPYDLAGTASDFSAKPFATTALPDGDHLVSALVKTSDGTVSESAALINVANDETGDNTLQSDPNALFFSATPDNAAGSRNLDVFTGSGSSTDFAISANQPWINLSTTAGTTPATISVSTDVNGLAFGTYDGMVSITSSGLPSLNVPVELKYSDQDKCSPSSCSEVRVDLPYQLSFTEDEGGLSDQSGLGTGFTWIDQPYNGDGYKPENLDLDFSAGTLTVTTTSGIAYLGDNALDNALGVGFQAPNQKTLVSTQLINPPAGSGNYEQAGLYFGNDQDNYVKTVIVSKPSGTEIQYLLEVAGERVAEGGKPMGNLSTSDVTLSLLVDPYLRTVSALYRIDDGSSVKLGAVSPPEEFFSFDAAGIDPEIGTRSFTGITATHRHANAPLQYVFDDFSLLDGGGVIAPESSVEFLKKTHPVSFPTSMVWGPDDRLYVTELFGVIHALTFDDEMNVVNEQEITSLVDALGPRLTLGITVGPNATASNVDLWVGHSSPSIDDGEPNSGMISHLSGANFTSVEHPITGIPRAQANHGTNSIHFGPDNRLYIAQGGNTGAGAPNSANTEFGTMEEQPLSAALLVADVFAAGFDGTCNNSSNIFGPPPCDVVPYATGLRNMYDFVFHSNGNLYAPDNGLGVTGTFPPSPQPECFGMASTTSYLNGGHNPGSQPDILLKLEQGKYYGHPNPYRDECVFKDGSFQNVAPMQNYQPPIYTIGDHTSSNAIVEYNAPEGCVADTLNGQLLITNYSVGDDVFRMRLDASGNSVVEGEPLITGFNDPLPMTTNPQGVIFVGEFGGDVVSALDPVSLGCWEGLSAGPFPILDPRGIALGNKLYAVGGKDASGHLNSLLIYDTQTDSWSAGNNLPGPGVENPAGVAYNGQAYVFGGSQAPFSGAVANSSRYNPATGQWSTLAPMPTARGGASAEVVGDRIYVVGGMDTNGASVNLVEIYNPATNTWSTGTPMTTRRDNPGTAVLDGNLYVFGGRTRNADGTTIDGTLNSVEMFSASTGTWTARAPMPTGRRTMVVGTLNDRAQVIGGEDSGVGNGVFPQNEEYDPTTDTWRSLTQIPTPKHGAAGGTIGDRMYVFGGGDSSGTSFTSTLDALKF
ncbi:Kelch repeat-containing protein [Halospina denitrificans]|nr:kelch repeat-containing protein [Halospina denitrificans]